MSDPTRIWAPSRRSLTLGAGALLAAGCSARAQPDSALIAMPGVTFPLKTVPGQRYPEDAAGKPFFLNGDTAWAMAAGLKREDADFYLRDRAARGFTAIQTQIIVKYSAVNAPANAYGDLPFSRMVDFRTPNEAYFAHLDWVVARARALGLLLVMAPSWLGAKGELGGFYQEMRAAGPDAMHAYGLYLGRRYAAADNIMWLLGGDYNPPEKLLVRRMAEGIRDGGSTGLRTVHCAPFTSPLDHWSGESWIDIDNLYAYSDLWGGALKEYQRPQRMPFFMVESGYENEPELGASENGIRRQAYEAVLGGAFGHVFGCAPIWHLGGPGTGGRLFPDWRAYLDTPGARGMKVMHDLFASVAWWKLAPDVDGRMLQDAGDGADKAVAAIDRERRLAICYLPAATPVSVNTSFFPGAVRAEWRDPASGATQPAQPSARAGTVATFAPPSRNSSGTPDWTLILRAAG